MLLLSGHSTELYAQAHPTVIQQWPGNNAPSSEKVPTEILYDEEEPMGIRWGYEIPPDTQRYQWFKM